MNGGAITYNSSRPHVQNPSLREDPMQEIDQRDRELLGALQGEIPLVSTPYAVIGQMIEMSEKEVIKRTERLKREGSVHHLGAHFDARALGYRSCLVAAKVSPLAEQRLIPPARSGSQTSQPRSGRMFRPRFANPCGRRSIAH